ncbi:hypothetical protein RIF29_14697 [Crotalaria pallida]|uniref:Uncharacterized protein n=1 Tax=Crotalaria pallida TaxID=3830 RepID=A0AAN9IDZ8_CROPI
MYALFPSLNPNSTTFLPPPPGITFPIHAAATSAAATATAATSANATTQILIPKLEPFEGWVDTPTPQQGPHQQQNFSHGSHPLLNLFGDETLAAPAGSFDINNNNNENDAVTDFHQLSEIFRIAFSKGLQQLPDSNNDPKDAVLDMNSGAIVPVPPGFQSLDSPGAGAIVPVPPGFDSQDSPGAGAGALTTPRSRAVKELVRVTDFGGVKEQRHFREVVRKTRLIYDSLRVKWTKEEERKAESDNRKARADLKASNSMRSAGLWLNRDQRIVGAIPGVCIGDVFLYRMELCVVGLHGQPQAGIDYLPASFSSNGEPIATSVIVSGGYEDDLDEGDVIIYSGHGGQDKHFKQVFHQKLEGGNLAMERSMQYGIEVRVIRGVRCEGTATASGKVYVYDGLYRIVNCWFDVGKSGFGVFKFKLCRIDGQSKMGSSVLKEAMMLWKDPSNFKYLSLDISNKKESTPVRLFNDIDTFNDPLHFEYLPKTNFQPVVFHQSGRVTGCECVDGCGDGCFCAMKNGGEFPYNLNGILLRGKPLVFECGPFCHCPPHCRNRVTQKGLKNRLEVFRSMETGWGVRSLDLIQAGAFICEYTGVVLTREQSEILTMNGDRLIYPNRFSDRWAEWGDLSLINPEYERPSYPSIPPLDFALDVSTLRNVACYISHSSTPNVFVQFVLYDHNNLMFPRLMLFAMESIPPMRELSLDYGVADEVTGKLSICN